MGEKILKAQRLKGTETETESKDADRETFRGKDLVKLKEIKARIVSGDIETEL